MINKKMIYYGDTNKFSKDDWYFAFRYLNRLLQLKSESYKEEVRNINLELLTDEMKKFINAMIYATNKEYLYDEFENIKGIQSYNQPMKEKIILEDDENCIYFINNKLSERNIYIFL